MDPDYIERNHIVDRYLLQQLSADESSEFEEYYFENPEMLAQLEIAKAMHETVREQSSQLLLQEESQHASWIERWLAPRYGFALSCVLGACLAGLLIQHSQIESLDSYALPASSFSLETTRGSAPTAVKIRTSTQRQASILQIETGPIGYSQVKVNISDSSERLVWEGVAEVDNSLGVINLVLLTNNFASGDYLLQLSTPDQNNTELMQYQLEIIND